MNPGTVLFIILGIIGLLIYISKALKPSSLENFAVIDESSISNRGREGLSKLQEANLNLESIIGAITTPAVSVSNTTGFGGGSMPSVSDFAKMNKPAAAPRPTFTDSQFDKANITPAQISAPVHLPSPVVQPVVQPVAQIPKTPDVNKAPALPQLTPASFINMQQQSSDIESKVEIKEPMTVSDKQGTLLTKSTLPFEKQKSKQIEKQKEKQEKRKKRKTKIVYMNNECPKLPDMSLYIRKDSIPCWGCNLK